MGRKCSRICIIVVFCPQRFGSEIEQIENWLKRKKEDLNSVNYGDSLEETERMLVQQDNMMSTVDKFQQNLNDLASSADNLTRKVFPDNELMKRKYENLKNGIQEAEALAARRYERLQESMLYFKFRNHAKEVSVFMKVIFISLTLLREVENIIPDAENTEDPFSTMILIQ